MRPHAVPVDNPRQHDDTSWDSHVPVSSDKGGLQGTLRPNSDHPEKECPPSYIPAVE